MAWIRMQRLEIHVSREQKGICANLRNLRTRCFSLILKQA